ncbi:MAG: DUF4214 domain-containing protein [Candidatus Competibacteraceae bacterium]|nr:DUF4214 domain-containing protein [Candidatus Competibacteraceae bacterium]
MMQPYFRYFLLATLMFLWPPTILAAPRFPASLDGLQPSGLRPAATQGGFTVDPTVRETVRLFYNTVYSSSESVDAGWNGDITTCQAGTTSSEHQAATLRRVNWYRAMAGVPANIVFDSEFSRKAQQAALMMSANNRLSHTPPSSWTCYTADGAEAAGKANLYLGNAGSDAINGYLQDAGSSNYPIGHRRWILYPQTQFMGTGDVVPINGAARANALWVFDNNMWGPRPSVRDDFIAWPPQGYTPYPTVYPRWSFSYPSADFSGASVTMTKGGSSINVKQESYVTGYGENTLVWIPAPYSDGQSWAQPTADETYQVTVSSVLINSQVRSFNYTVTVFDPAVKGADFIAQTISGSDQVTVGQPTNYAFSTVNDAQGYQWRQGSATDYLAVNGAESGIGDFVATISSDYSAVSTDRPASGGAAYHLAHPQPVDQVLLLNKTLFVGPAGSLQFSSFLGYATPGQRALVEVSEDEGQSWKILFEQVGNDAPESGYTTKSILLTEYIDKTILLRFRYQHTGGSYYPQTTDNTGWFFDDVRFIDVDVADFSTPLMADTPSTFTFTGVNVGRYLLQVRPLLFGDFPGEWSTVKTVQTENNGAIVLSVSRSGNGAVTSNPAGIDCGTDCTESYNQGVTITLTATPANGSTFAGWSGACSGTGVCTVVMNAAKNVTATFTTTSTAFQSAAQTISWFYAAAFSRTPVPNSSLAGYGDIGGLVFWTQAYLTGEGALAAYRGDVYAIADFFVSSAEFQATYPASLTQEQFVTALYQNMLSREPDAGGLAFWVGRLNSGVSRGVILADFTNSEENRNANLLRKAALISYIAFMDADADKTITPEEAATWLAAHPDLDGAVVD